MTGRSRNVSRRGAAWIALVLTGCELVDAEPAAPAETRLALYSVPSTLAGEEELTLVGAKLFPGEDHEEGSFCLRLTAERGLLSAPGASPAATDAGAPADAGAAEACAAPRCLDLRFVRQGKVRLAYGVYAAPRQAANDLLVGTAYQSSVCPGTSALEPAARATLLLYPPATVAPGAASRDGAPDEDPGDDARDAEIVDAGASS